jgi:O-antigen/teichoic acid export membrane protein
MSIKNQVKSGLFWVFIDTIFLRSFSLLITVGLARILSPEDFGLVGIISIFILLGSAIVEGGMGNSIIRDKGATVVDFTTVFYGNLALSFIIYSTLFFTAPLIANYFEKPILIGLIRIYGVSFILSALFNIQQSVLMKNMHFKKITLYNLPATIIGSLLGLYLAYLGYGVLSLIYMSLSTLAIKVIIYWINSDWFPKREISLIKLRKHFKFGYKLMLSSLLETSMQEVYSFLIGKKFSISTLGYFKQAKSFRNYPVLLFTTVLSKVSYPMLSKIQDDKDKVAKTYSLIIRSIFFIACPAMFCLILVAKPLFILVLTEKWLPAVPYFQILALSGMLIPIHLFNINILKVYARTDLFLKLEVIKVALTLVSISFGIFFGIYGLLISIVITSFIALFINTFYSSKLISYTTLDQIKDTTPIFLIGFLSCTLSYFIMLFTKRFSNLLTVLILVSVYLSFYLLISYLFNKKALVKTCKLGFMLIYKKDVVL